MPVYNFRDPDTEEVFEVMMKISELDEFKKENPSLVQMLLSAPSLVSDTGGIKNDGGWQESMQRIAEAHPASPLADRYGKKSIREVKTREVLNKHMKKRDQ